MTDHVIVSDRAFHELHDESWGHLMEADDELLADLMPKAVSNGTVTKIEWPTQSAMAIALSRAMNFVRISKKGEESDTAPPSTLVKSILERWREEHADSAVDAVRKLYGA